MRNKPHNKSPDELIKAQDKRANDRFCKICHVGTYKLHPEFPEKYLKCEVCGHCIDIIDSDKKTYKLL